jgi:hypothetical protein
MTQEDIFKMAQEAGFDVHRGEWLFQMLERFAALVAAAEREACAKLVWPTQEVKVWSDNELEAMTGAFNQAQEKHGWYETIMAVGATALKARAAAIRARGEK